MKNLKVDALLILEYVMRGSDTESMGLSRPCKTFNESSIKDYVSRTFGCTEFMVSERFEKLFESDADFVIMYEYGNRWIESDFGNWVRNNTDVNRDTFVSSQFYDLKILIGPDKDGDEVYIYCWIVSSKADIHKR